ncbi:MAG: hypothetical protein OEV42_13810 [Deltaproteobacteria bacterium]|nr:hypothetical protein [Deltaproteobacteria bacterium]
MKRKVIYCECFEPFWIEVAKQLEKDYGFVPCYWTGPFKVKQDIKNNFSKVIYHDSFAAMRGVPSDEFKGYTLPCLNGNLLKELSFNESVALGMMNRMDPHKSFSYQDRIRLYHSQLRYWLCVLNHFSPDIVVFPYIPHVVFDYILYVLCKRENIKTVIFQTTPAFNNSLIFPLESFETQTTAELLFKSYLSSDKSPNVQLSKIAEDYLIKLKGDYSQAIPFYADNVIQLINGPKKINYFLNVIKNLLKAPYYFITLLKMFYRPGRLNYLKHKKKKIEDGTWTDFEYRLYKYRAKREKKKLESYYNSLVQNVDLNIPYVYAAFHYQPECSTAPLGNAFVHQLLMVDILSKSVPQGWQIYVKENFWQNSPYSHGERARDKEFYDDLVALPNVKLVPTSVSPWDLIDNAKIVATVTGTTGWEAVMRRKPAFIFGHAWYRGCEGIFYVPTLEKCKEAIEKIEKGFKVDYDKIRLFMFAVEQVCFKGYSSSNFRDAADILFRENINGLKNSILKVYENDKPLFRTPNTADEQHAAIN